MMTTNGWLTINRIYQFWLLMACYLFCGRSNVEEFVYLFSRQRYVLGDSAMHRLARSDVFLYGIGGLGVEIGKLVSLS